MRNFMRNIVAAVGIALSVLSVASLSVPVAFAQPVPLGQRSFSPRLFPTQQLHYTRFSVNFNSCVYVSLTCSVKVGTVPYNAFLLRAYGQTSTAWNAGTSATLSLGTASGGAQVMAGTLTTGFTAGTSVLAAGGFGTLVTGAGIAQSGTLGGFDVFATVTIVGALPTAGSTQFVMEWVAPNDGSCTQVPLGATAPAC